MNASTSGNAPHGLNTANANVFSYWQYIDKLVYWGGSSGEGLIVAPSADVIDAAHRNGVPVLGTVFFPQAAVRSSGSTTSCKRTPAAIFP